MARLCLPQPGRERWTAADTATLAPAMRPAATAVIVLALAAIGTAGVPVFVMLPLDAVGHDNTLTDPEGLRADLAKLKQAGVAGFMTDVWFGLCEPAPQAYNFTGYVELARMASDLDLKIQAVMSFHKARSLPQPPCTPSLTMLPAWMPSSAEQTAGRAISRCRTGRGRRRTRGAPPERARRLPPGPAATQP